MHLELGRSGGKQLQEEWKWRGRGGGIEKGHAPSMYFDWPLRRAAWHDGKKQHLRITVQHWVS